MRDDARFVEAATSGEMGVGRLLRLEWAGDEDALELVAVYFAFEPVKHEMSERGSPVICNDDLAGLLEEVLAEAGGPVALGVLVRVVRTGLGWA